MDPEKKSLHFIFPTKYVIPKSLKFSHWPSKIWWLILSSRIPYLGKTVKLLRPLAAKGWSLLVGYISQNPTINSKWSKGPKLT